MNLERIGLKIVQQPAEQPELVIVAKLAPVRDVEPPTGVAGDDRQPARPPRPDRTPRPQADCDVDRLRALVEQVEGPDIERSAREIDPRWRGGFDVHPRL